MTKRMLIDASHAEETRVVVLDGNRLEDFDVEAASRKQIKGNIYLAKVVRVEPSLQAAFVEYGGNRHGFLAFSEIHPDYYQIPVADRQRLLAMQEEEAREEEEAEEAELSAAEASGAASAADEDESSQPLVVAADGMFRAGEHEDTNGDALGEDGGDDIRAGDANGDEAGAEERDDAPSTTRNGHPKEERERRAPRFLRNYKIQEVIKRRQILLIQVVKEERGNKGAALTTYISLAGRYCVLMPNSPRGGGVSRKITSATDRRRLKDIIGALEIPRGMGMIVRTAGANRPKTEVMRDCEYLLRLWDDIRDTTMRSSAPALIHEEANLIKRAIRDVYTSAVEEVLVDGEEGWRAARDIMRMLMPSHARKVTCWNANRDSAGQPLFARYQVESQLDAILSPNVSLKSGGYLVINQAEALVAIDVNSGRSTRERGIEETALRTNLEAADEVARQLRLRDLAGLIVIDFIDMESRKHNAMVERRVKEALKTDRARIQVGQISSFGLLEMSRQRLRPSLSETSMITCPHCNGLGLVRTTEGAAVHVLRAIEEEGARRRYAEIMVHAAADVAFYILNNRRDFLATLEARFSMRVLFAADPQFSGSQLRIEKIRARSLEDAAPLPPVGLADPQPSIVDDDAVYNDEPEGFATFEAVPAAAETPAPAQREDGDAEEDQGDGDRRRRRRRRRRRGTRRDGTNGSDAEMQAGADEADEDEADEESADTEGDAHPDAVLIEAAPAAQPAAIAQDSPIAPAEAAGPDSAALDASQEGAEGAEEAKPRRRGRRGGRGRRQPLQAQDYDTEDLPYTGPTPADPFGGQPIDIFDVIEQAERTEAPPVQHAPQPAFQPIPAPAGEAPAEQSPASPALVTAEEAAGAALQPDEPFVAPPIRPVLIADAAPRAKRGWWKR